MTTKEGPTRMFGGKEDNGETVETEERNGGQ